MPTMEEREEVDSGESCAQCSVTGVPLLACDDPDARAKLPPSAGKPRFCNNCMIGKKVRVFWPVDDSWYTGVVQEYDVNSDEHLLRYQDGDTEWVKIGENNTNSSAVTGGFPPEAAATRGRGASNNAMDHHSHHQQHPDAMEPMKGGRDGPDGVERDMGERNRWPGASEGYPGPYFASGPYGGQGAVPPGAMPGYGAMPGMTPYGMMYPPPYGGHMFPPGYGQQPLGMGKGDDSGHLSMGGDNNPYGRRKSGPKAWSKHEDELLLSIVQSMQWPMKWTVVAQSLPDRTGKQCRERYVNHLNPRLKVSDWTLAEDATIFHLYNSIGSHWARMSKVIPGRTDNGIKNRFHNIRRQYEREDEHRLRLSANTDFPEEIRLDRLREFPKQLQGNSAELWDMQEAIGILAAQSVLGNGATASRNSNRFGPFKEAKDGEVCVRCGFILPSLQTGKEVCSKTGWCKTCTKVSPHASSSFLRECLNLRRCQNKELRAVIESWEEFFAGQTPAPEKKASEEKSSQDDDAPVKQEDESVEAA